MKLTHRLEAVLFVAGEPVPLAELARALAVSTRDAQHAIDELSTAYADRGAGLRVLRSPEGVQLVTAPEVHEAVEAYVKAGMRERLTPAAAETLAIVAYRGPISRAGVEAIRGVNSSFTLRLLALRGLVTRAPHPSDPRRFVYEVSAEFLRTLGVASVEELPDFATLRAHAGMTKLAAEAETQEAAGDRTAAQPPSAAP